MTDGLIVKEPFAKKLVTGKKKTEYRSKPLPDNKTNVKIWILNKGFVKGWVIFSGAKYDEDDEIWKYKVSDCGRFIQEPEYVKKNGCVIWMNDVVFKK